MRCCICTSSRSTGHENEYVATTVRCGKTTFTVIAGYIPPLALFDCHRLDAIITIHHYHLRALPLAARGGTETVDVGEGGLRYTGGTWS